MLLIVVGFAASPARADVATPVAELRSRSGAADSSETADPGAADALTPAAPEPPTPRPWSERHKTAVTWFAIEAAGALLASSGYVAEAIDREPSAGAEFTGGTYVTLGGLGVAFTMVWATDPSLTSAGRWGWIAALAGLIALGAYDLSLSEKTPSADRIFRDNVIGINVVVATTAATKWIVGRRSGTGEP